ncbi:MAG: hypothetical protein Fur0032_03590 [Terrimicrobiaceae bacterium]
MQLFWTIRGSGSFQLGGRTKTVKPGDTFIYESGEAHHLIAGDSGWDYRFFTMDSSGAPAICKLFELPRHHKAGPCPESLFVSLEESLASPTIHSPRHASIDAYRILESASRSAPAVDPQNQDWPVRIKAAMEFGFRDPNWGVDGVASQFSLHRTTIRRLFLRTYGVSPGHYLARLRLQCALSMLRTTNQSVAEVAGRSGFRSAEYLARVVRAATGMSPSDFRKS